MGNTALICGGLSGSNYEKSCYSLKEDGAWELEASSLNTARQVAATGGERAPLSLQHVATIAWQKISSLKLKIPVK